MTDSVIDSKQAALAAIEGLTFADVVQFFNNKATDRERKIADLADTREGEFEVDDAIISEGEDNGAYVMGWSWVSFQGVEGLDKDDACPDCGAIEGTPEWGTVGDGFDGYCPSCADKREESGEHE